VRGPLHAGSVTEGLLLAGSVQRNGYANKYWKVLLFPAGTGKSQNSLKGSEQARAERRKKKRKTTPCKEAVDPPPVVGLQFHSLRMQLLPRRRGAERLAGALFN
jgi:hypothetical protein